MKPVVKKLLLVVAVAILFAFIGFEFGLAISGNSIPAILLILGFAAIVLWYLLRRAGRSSSMEAARTYAMQWWKRTHSEELSREESRGFVGYFGPHKHYGFRFKRMSGKPGQWCVIVVSASEGRLDIADFEDAPTTEQTEDPFRLLEGYLHRTPVPTKEMPKYLDWIPPYTRRRGRGVNINIGGVGASEEPKPPETEGEGEG